MNALADVARNDIPSNHIVRSISGLKAPSLVARLDMSVVVVTERVSLNQDPRGLNAGSGCRSSAHANVPVVGAHIVEHLHPCSHSHTDAVVQRDVGIFHGPVNAGRIARAAPEGRVDGTGLPDLT